MVRRVMVALALAALAGCGAWGPQTAPDTVEATTPRGLGAAMTTHLDGFHTSRWHGDRRISHDEGMAGTYLDAEVDVTRAGAAGSWSTRTTGGWAPVGAGTTAGSRC